MFIFVVPKRDSQNCKKMAKKIKKILKSNGD